jgi:hypothetical protein
VEKWTRRSLLVVALGAVTNLLLTFVPDVVPPWVAATVVISMAVLLVLITAVLVPRWLFGTYLRSRERRLRGIVSAGNDRKRDEEFTEVWTRATERVLCFGVGLTRMAYDDEIIRETVGRGVEVHFVMIDPEWLAKNDQVSRVIEDYYRFPQTQRFLAQARAAHRTLRELAAELNEEHGARRVRVHTFRSLVGYSAVIADPGRRRESGVLEFHMYARAMGRFRLQVRGYAGGAVNPSFLHHMVASISKLAGFDFGRPPGPLLRD